MARPRQDLNTNSDAGDIPGGPGEPLFEGDQGTLSFEERQLLVYLLRGPYLLRSDRPHVWKTLVMARARVEEMLNNLFLTLVCDEDLGIAFCRQVNTDDLQAPQLLREFHVTFLDSALLLGMRQRLLDAEVRGEPGFIAMDSNEEILRTFDPAARTNERLFKKHLNGVMTRLQERRLLKKAGESHMYEISPVLRLIFNAAEISALRDAYAAKARRDLETELAVTGSDAAPATATGESGAGEGESAWVDDRGAADDSGLDEEGDKDE